MHSIKILKVILYGVTYLYYSYNIWGIDLFRDSKENILWLSIRQPSGSKSHQRANLVYDYFKSQRQCFPTQSSGVLFGPFWREHWHCKYLCTSQRCWQMICQFNNMCSNHACNWESSPCGLFFTQSAVIYFLPFNINRLFSGSIKFIILKESIDDFIKLKLSESIKHEKHEIWRKNF